MAILNINTNVLAFSDTEVGTSDPIRRNVDWGLKMNGLAVNLPSSKEYSVDPGATLAIFSGTRGLAVDGTTAFALTLNPVSTGVYRLTSTGGTAPAFRTDRALQLSTIAVTVTVNNNATAVFSLPTAAHDFTPVVVGDNIFIPSVSTGDSQSPFNSLNAGLWLVLSKAAGNKSITCRRLFGEVFSGTSETVTPASNGQIQAFSAGPVRVGDSLSLVSGFSAVSLGNYTVSAVTASWLEFTSTQSLPLESGILPTAAGINVYSQAKRFLHVESDQPVMILLNGDTTSSLIINPITVGDPRFIGWFELWSSVWSLSVKNLSTGSGANVFVISCE